MLCDTVHFITFESIENMEKCVADSMFVLDVTGSMIVEIQIPL